jgi:hypothetical protein
MQVPSFLLNPPRPVLRPSAAMSHRPDSDNRFFFGIDDGKRESARAGTVVCCSCRATSSSQAFCTGSFIDFSIQPSALSLQPDLTDAHVGAGALTRPAERSSAVLDPIPDYPATCSPGQPVRRPEGQALVLEGRKPLASCWLLAPRLPAGSRSFSVPSGRVRPNYAARHLPQPLSLLLRPPGPTTNDERPTTDTGDLKPEA